MQVKDGSLGTLSGGQQFVALDSDGPLLTALVNASNGYNPAGTPDAGYLLQTIDVPSRTITRQRNIQLPQFSTPKLCSLPNVGIAVIGLQKVSAFLPGTVPDQEGYTITRFDL